ncbi:polycomb complex protein BMI-1 [Striga asiatica]|uniref:Polycomb complex protein BMI-1 n=1 Tax=Striga asiatica TaxID=4170 RepID=A0A5A7PL23_STRAF|nr:polycomb complex protein BMI-1 [Striga asiatica]
MPTTTDIRLTVTERRREGCSDATVRGSVSGQSRPLPAANCRGRRINFSRGRRRDLSSGHPRQWRRRFPVIGWLRRRPACDRALRCRNVGDGVLNGGESELNTSGSDAAPGGLSAADVGQARASGSRSGGKDIKSG